MYVSVAWPSGHKRAHQTDYEKEFAGVRYRVRQTHGQTGSSYEFVRGPRWLLWVRVGAGRHRFDGDDGRRKSEVGVGPKEAH